MGLKSLSDLPVMKDMRMKTCNRKITITKTKVYSNEATRRFLYLGSLDEGYASLDAESNFNIPSYNDASKKNKNKDFAKSGSFDKLLSEMQDHFRKKATTLYNNETLVDIAIEILQEFTPLNQEELFQILQNIDGMFLTRNNQEYNDIHVYNEGNITRYFDAKIQQWRDDHRGRLLIDKYGDIIISLKHYQEGSALEYDKDEEENKEESFLQREMCNTEETDNDNVETKPFLVSAEENEEFTVREDVSGFEKIGVNKEEEEQAGETTTKFLENHDPGVMLHEAEWDLSLETTDEALAEDDSPEISSTCYSKETERQIFFQWLSGEKNWVSSFYYMQNEITIHADNRIKTAEEIYTKIAQHFPQLQNSYKVLFSDPGFCVSSARSCSVSLGAHPDNASDESYLEEQSDSASNDEDEDERSDINLPAGTHSGENLNDSIMAEQPDAYLGENNIGTQSADTTNEVTSETRATDSLNGAENFSSGHRDNCSVAQLASEEDVLYPSQKICCYKNPDVLQGRKGRFAGEFCGYGITAGHIAKTSNQENPRPMICIQRNDCQDVVVGHPILNLLVDKVDIPIPGTSSFRTTTADMLLFKFSDHWYAKNTIEADLLQDGHPKIYEIILHKGPIKEGDQVVVILDGLKFGKIKMVDFNITYKENGNNYVSYELTNMLYIVDENDLALTTDGDSGAPIVLRPNVEDSTLKAVGMVTHLHYKWKPGFENSGSEEPTSENSIPSGTIAIRLYENLCAIKSSFPILKLSTIEFSGQQASSADYDSGLHSRPIAD